MTFTLRPSASGDTLVASRDPIRTNFSVIQTRWAVNHQDINTGGKHVFVEMPNQTVIPPGLVINESTFYTKNAQGTSQVFWTNENSSNEYQMTRADNALFTLFGTNTAYQAKATPKPKVTGGWTFLPGQDGTGGMLLQYGTTNDANLNANFQIDFPKPFTSFVGSVLVSAIRNDTQDKTVSIFTGSITLTGFQLEVSSNNLPTGATWIAIGV